MTSTQQRILITGAGSGLGLALAQQLARGGAKIACVDIDEARAKEAAASLTGDGHWAAKADIAKYDDWAAVAARTEAEWGGVDVLVNNAGVSSGGNVADTTLDDWQWMLDINLLGVVRGCKAFIPMLTATANHGRIVNIASFAGIASAPGMAAYNVAKAGVISLSESLRAELDDAGIGVTVVCPAFFKTNLLETFRSPSPAQKAMVEKFMTRSHVTADDVAADIVAAMHDDKFLVITHKGARRQALMKRIMPELYFKKLIEVTRGFAKGRA